MNNLGRGFLWVLVALFGLAGTPALAQGPPPPPPTNANEGPAFLVISLDGDFAPESLAGPAARTMVVPLGIFAGAVSLDDTTFTPADAVFVPVAFLPDDVSFADLNGNATTIIGAFQEDNEGGAFHLINAAEDAVIEEVAEAIYNATRNEGFSSLFWDSELEEPLFPTTTDIAEFIAGFPPLFGEEQEDVDQEDVDAVHDAIFGTDDTLTVPDPGSPTVECEGELFPHTEESGPIFDFAFVVNDQGAFDLALCEEIMEVEIDIKPGSNPNSINLKKKGVIAVAVFSTGTFDALDIDPDTVELGGVPPVKDSVEDVDGDGLDDLVVHFDVPELKAGGFLNMDTVRLTLVGEKSDGVCVRGSDSVSITPNNK